MIMIIPHIPTMGIPWYCCPCHSVPSSLTYTCHHKYIMHGVDTCIVDSAFPELGTVQPQLVIAKLNPS